MTLKLGCVAGLQVRAEPIVITLTEHPGLLLVGQTLDFVGNIISLDSTPPAHRTCMDIIRRSLCSQITIDIEVNRTGLAVGYCGARPPNYNQRN